MITPTMKPIRIQWMPNLVKSEKRICLTRIRWESMKPMNTHEIRQASHKLSISLCWKWQDLWVGAFWKGPIYPGAGDRFTLWICLLPCLPIRIKLNRTFGGIFP